MKHYQATWQPVDSELYALCSRRPSQRNYADVFSKVTIIGRVYEAGLPRAWRGGGDPEVEAANYLMGKADFTDQRLQRLVGQPFDRSSLVEIIGFHGTLTRGLSSLAGESWLISFVSKYLHFHCPIVPIFDSRADKNRRLEVDRTTAARLRKAIAKPEDWADAYYRFAIAFMVLYERAYVQTSLQPTVKEIDHLLWRPRHT
jgi:hypothetical protein